MLGVLRQRNFALLWIAGLISMAGDWALIVGLPIEVYRRTGSTLATAGIVLATLIPSVVLGSVAGVYVDRWDRRRLMVVVNLLLAVTILPLLAVNSAGIWVAYAVLAAASCLEQLFQPAEIALLPSLLEGGEAQLVPANALSNMNRQLARIVGPAIGGIAVAAGGLVAVTVVDAISFLLAAGLILAIRTTRPTSLTASEAPIGDGALPDPPAATAGSAWAKLVHEWREGIAILLGQPVLRALALAALVAQFGEGLTATLFVPWATDVLHTDAAGYGSLLSAQAIGGLTGALVIGRAGARIDPKRMLVLAAVAFGLIDLVLFTYPVVFPYIGPALVGMVVVGLPAAAIGTAFTTLQQTQSPDSHRGRVIGALGALGAVSSLCGAVAAGLLGESIPIVVLLVIQGSGYVIAGLAFAALTRSRA